MKIYVSSHLRQWQRVVQLQGLPKGVQVLIKNKTKKQKTKTKKQNYTNLHDRRVLLNSFHLEIQMK